MKKIILITLLAVLFGASVCCAGVAKGFDFSLKIISITDNQPVQGMDFCLYDQAGREIHALTDAGGVAAFKIMCAGYSMTNRIVYQNTIFRIEGWPDDVKVPLNLPQEAIEAGGSYVDVHKVYLDVQNKLVVWNVPDDYLEDKKWWNPVKAETRDEKWRQNLQYMAKKMEMVHKNLYHSVSRQKFLWQIDQLSRMVPFYDGDMIEIQIARIVALVGDAHTSMHPSVFMQTYPLQLNWIGNELYVTGDRDGSTAGMAVSAINGMPVDEAAKRIDRIVSHDNIYSLRDFDVIYFTNPVALYDLGISDSADSVTYTLRAADGRSRDIVLNAVNTFAADIQSFYKTKTITEPMYMQRDSELYWMQPLNAQALYIRYSACEEDKNHPMQQFADEVAQKLAADKYQRVIMDLRDNHGGDSVIIKPLLEKLEQARQEQRLKIIALINAGTFSSGEFAAYDLKRQCHAVLIGQPSGQKPNAYGNVKMIELPYFGVRIGCSSKYFNFQFKGDGPDALYPDINVSITAKDYFSGRDAVLEAALKY